MTIVSEMPIDRWCVCNIIYKFLRISFQTKNAQYHNCIPLLYIIVLNKMYVDTIYPLK